MNNNNLRSVTAVILALLALAGCSTLEYVPIDRSRPEELRTRLKVGETVHLRLQNGEQHEFRIVALESDAIVGRDRRVAYQDIDLLEVSSRDVEGTAKTALAATALAVVVVGGAILEAELDAQPASEAACRTNGTGGMICKPK
jgi:hypothetical protein